MQTAQSLEKQFEEAREAHREILAETDFSQETDRLIAKTSAGILAEMERNLVKYRLLDEALAFVEDLRKRLDNLEREGRDVSELRRDLDYFEAAAPLIVEGKFVQNESQPYTKPLDKKPTPQAEYIN